MGGEKSHITKRPCKLEVPIAGRRYTLNRHDLAFAHASHDQAPHHAASRLAVTVLTVMPQQPKDLFKLVRLDDRIVSRVAIADILDQRAVGVRHSR